MNNPQQKAHVDLYPRFIVFEGIDGSGTTTQTEMLVQALRTSKAQVYSTFEPTDSCIGNLIRNVLQGKHRITATTMAHLFSADRQEHVSAPDTGILHYLKQGSWVVSDRYVFSSLAYQGPEVGYPRVLELNAGIPYPKWVFHLSLDTASAMQRLNTRNILDIYENTAFQDKVSQAYNETYTLFDTTDARWHILDGNLSAEEIHQQVCTVLGIAPIY